MRGAGRRVRPTRPSGPRVLSGVGTPLGLDGRLNGAMTILQQQDEGRQSDVQEREEDGRSRRTGYAPRIHMLLASENSYFERGEAALESAAGSRRRYHRRE